jgi:hypothetical protein
MQTWTMQTWTHHPAPLAQVDSAGRSREADV